ncbi:MAG: methyltransferase family protein [Smithellaceae bacterium]
MIRLCIFALISVFITYVSRKSLLRPRSHGFARFFAWEFILALVLLNAPYWFKNPLSPGQIISWLFLIISIYLAAHGIYMLRVVGKPNKDRPDPALLELEKTSALITTGVYKYIRHPLYSSLLFLAWGAFLKNPAGLGCLLASVSSFFLFLTARNDEAECLDYFGKEYQLYMEKTRRFIPFLF